MNVVRFAPSPTGNIHIGNIRTAIFDWLFARNTKGKFLLRIEDTDKERSTKEAIKTLLKCMEWLGLDHDDQIFYQSSQEEAHRDAARRLLGEGKAYYPVMENSEAAKPIILRIPWNSENCSNVRIVGNVELSVCQDKPVEIAREGVKFSYLNEKGRVVENSFSLAGYRKLKLFGSGDNLVFEIENHVDEILKNNKRFTFTDCKKITYERREVFYNDMIKGELSKPLDSMKDFVILRSDGTPVFHLANVCDDISQGVTHIIRGDDHVENTYKHIFLFDALNYPIPKYAHMPMIVNQSGKPYSKRDGDAFVGDFEEKGYLPDALFNYLSLLGWSPGDNREKMSRKEMIESFSLDRVKSAPAQFDIVKLQNMNGLYMAELEDSVFFEMAYKEASKQGWAEAVEKGLFNKVAVLMKTRTKLISQVSDWKYFFFDSSPLFDSGTEYNLSSRSFSYDDKALKKAFKENACVKAIDIFKDNLKHQQQLQCHECFENVIRDTEKQCFLPEGKLNQPLRVALTGSMSGANLADTMFILGKERICNRIEKLLAKISKLGLLISD